MASVMVCVILFIKSVLKNKLGAKWHYYIWFLLLVKLLVPFSPQSQLSILNVVDQRFERLVIVQDNPVISTGKGLVDETGSKEKENRVSSDAISEQKLIENDSTANIIWKGFDKFNLRLDLLIPAIVWLAGVLLFSLYIALINIRLLLKTRKCEQSIDRLTDEILHDCKSFMNIRKNIPILLSMSINTPTYTGLVRPRILLPHDFIGKVNSDELKHIFLHELAHYKRRDLLFNWLAVILKILHWFNPLIWYGFYRMRHDCEAACDAMILSRMESDERLKYGHTIIHLLKIIPLSKSAPGAMGILTGKTQIKRRITMISLFKKESLPWTVAAIVLILFVGFFCLTYSTKDQPKASNTLNSIESEKYAELDSKYNELNNQLNNLNDNLKKQNERNQLLEENALKLQQQLKDYQMLAGITDVEGKGTIVTLNDNTASDKSKVDENILVRDIDIRNIINELTSAGVEAISVNDERLIATSEIKVAGSVILINNNRYSSPFIIKAIGNPEILERTLKMKDGIIDILKACQIGVNIETSENLIIPRYKGDLEFEYAQPTENSLQSLEDEANQLNAAIKELQNKNSENKQEALNAQVKNSIIELINNSLKIQYGIDNTLLADVFTNEFINKISETPKFYKNELNPYKIIETNIDTVKDILSDKFIINVRISDKNGEYIQVLHIIRINGKYLIGEIEYDI